MNQCATNRRRPKFACESGAWKQEIFGDCYPVGEGVSQLREHLGAGYRVYFGRHGQTVVILLCGGTKKSHPADIKTAKAYWEDWKRRQQ